LCGRRRLLICDEEFERGGWSSVAQRLKAAIFSCGAYYVRQAPDMPSGLEQTYLQYPLPLY
jgi:hypothetical protein